MKPENANNKGHDSIKKENQAIEKPSKKKMPKVVQNIILGTLATAAALESAGAIATELTDGKSFLNDPTYTDQSGIVQKVGYDLSHPLGFMTNLENDHKKVAVPQTFIENMDNSLLNHITGDDGTPIEQQPVTTEVITSKTLFNANANGLPISLDQFSANFSNYIEPFDNDSNTANVKLLFPVINPGNQIITVETKTRASKANNNERIDLSWGKTLLIPNKGTELIVPVPAATVEAFKLVASDIPNGNSHPDYIFRFEGPDKTTYCLDIRAEDNINDLSLNSALPILADTPEIDLKNFNPNDPQFINLKGETISTLTPILKTVKDNAQLTLRLFVVGKNSNGFSKFEFISSQEKLCYLP